MTSQSFDPVWASIDRENEPRLRTHTFLNQNFNCILYNYCIL